MTDPVIRVDLSEVQAAVLTSVPSVADRARIAEGLLAAAETKWINLAKRRLHSSSRAYVDGIAREGSNTLVLNGMLPNMVEQGWSGGDLRQWLLSGANAKQGKNGPYNVIPFGHGTPGSGGRNVGAAMPRPIHTVARKLTASISKPGQRTGKQGAFTMVWGQRLHPGLPMKQQARKILEKKQRPHHATSIYMGMVRKAQATSTGKMQTSGYQTFRTISQYSSEPGTHWVHPGIRARNLARDVQQWLEKQAAGIILTASGQDK